jgi:hypothetical protein
VRSLDARRVGAVRRVSEQLEVRPQERDDVGLVLGLGRQSQLLWLFVREHVATELWLLVQSGGECVFRVHPRFWCNWMEHRATRGHMGWVPMEV